MTEMNGIARRDLERLSAYLDGELGGDEAAKLEARLQTDKNLSDALQALRTTAELVHSLPEVPTPRSFALSEEMIRPRRAYPILQLSTALAALALIVVVGGDLLLSSAARPSLGAQDQAFFAVEQALPEVEAPVAATAPAPTATPSAEDTIMGEAESEQAFAPAAGAEAQADEAAEEEALRAAEAPAEEPLADESAALPAATGTAHAEEPFAEDGAELPGATGAAPVEGESTLKADADQLQPVDELSAEGDLEMEEPPSSINLLRAIELSLGAVLIVLIALTLWVRQRG